MDNLTKYYPAFEQVGLLRAEGLGCSLICERQGYECKSCPVQEALNKLYKLEHGKEIPNEQ